jgi:hypothetical protein
MNRVLISPVFEANPVVSALGRTGISCTASGRTIGQAG